MPFATNHDVIAEAEIPEKEPATTIQEDAKTWDIDERVVQGMVSAGITHFFSIQRQALPFILKGDEYRTGRHEDVCVSAPTGSGKTLVFVIATLQMLLDRVITRLRALVVLPSRDLAIQVKNVFDLFCDDASVDFADRKSVTKLSVGLTVGLRSLKEEQALICGPPLIGQDPKETIDRNLNDRASGRSRVDILVCTPGRLMDHIRDTGGFTLQHLRILVVDEADRLLAQSYQGWVKSVLNAVKAKNIPSSKICPWRPIVGGQGFVFDACAIPERQYGGEVLTHKNYRVTGGHLRKLLFSATLTNEPENMNDMALVNPRFVSLKEAPSKGQDDDYKFYAPEALVEHVVVCEGRDKALALFQLLESFRNFERTLVFTSSVENTYRLCLLLQIMEGEFGVAENLGGPEDGEDTIGKPSEFMGMGRIVEYSSRLSRMQRSNVLNAFRNQKSPLKVLVCSDAMARGLDIELVQNVVNYDLPVRAETYVHRVGRAARAGRSGCSYSLVKPSQMQQYRATLGTVKVNTVKEYKVDVEKIASAVPKFSHSLKILQEKVIGKKSGEDTTTGDTKKTRKKINTSKRPAVERHRNDWAVDL